MQERFCLSLRHGKTLRHGQLLWSEHALSFFRPLELAIKGEHGSDTANLHALSGKIFQIFIYMFFNIFIYIIYSISARPYQ